jgi:hypothetical protein
MNWTRSPGIVVLLGLSIAVGVQLADPFDARSPPPEKPSGNPTGVEMLTYSFEQLETADYTYDVTYVRSSGEREQFVRARIDHSDEEYEFTGPLGASGSAYYGNENGAWARTGENEGTHLGVFETGLRYENFPFRTPFDAEALRAAETTVVNRTTDAVVVRVDSTAQNAITDESSADAYTVYRLDASSYELRTATEHSTVDGEEVETVIEISKRDATQVERPSATKNPLLDLLGDLVA